MNITNNPFFDPNDRTTVPKQRSWDQEDPSIPLNDLVFFDLSKRIIFPKFSAKLSDVHDPFYMGPITLSPKQETKTSGTPPKRSFYIDTLPTDRRPIEGREPPALPLTGKAMIKKFFMGIPANYKKSIFGMKLPNTIF